VAKLWRESCFFIKTDESNEVVDRCATEAYEAAIKDYNDTYPDRTEFVNNNRLHPQSPGSLSNCRQVVSARFRNLYR
jgi:hypothetical protein